MTVHPDQQQLRHPQQLQECSPHYPSPDRVEPVAAAATALAAFAEATGMATFDAEFGAGSGSCFALFVGVRGEDF